jgi:hypothetical protein
MGMRLREGGREREREREREGEREREREGLVNIMYYLIILFIKYFSYI